MPYDYVSGSILAWLDPTGTSHSYLAPVIRDNSFPRVGYNGKTTAERLAENRKILEAEQLAYKNRMRGPLASIRANADRLRNAQPRSRTTSVDSGFDESDTTVEAYWPAPGAQRAAAAEFINPVAREPHAPVQAEQLARAPVQVAHASQIFEGNDDYIVRYSVNLPDIGTLPRFRGTGHRVNFTRSPSLSENGNEVSCVVESLIECMFEL